MVQRSLENWLTTPIKPCQIKKVMYLDWSNRNPAEVKWINEIPSECTFKKTILWKDINIEIILCGKIRSGNIFNEVEEKYKNFSYLKSHLQKCIRKGFDNQAIKTAKHMMKMDMINFIRRLTVIMVEDVILHESFGILLWLSISNIEITNYHAQWLLGVVYILCKNRTKDVLIIPNNKKTTLQCLLNSKYLNLNEYQYSILYSLKLRQSYGGLKCDVELFGKTADCWYNRFITSEKINVASDIIRPIRLILPDLNLEDWDLSAIDYHCAKFLLKIVLKEYEEYSEQKIKSLIWNFSSNINYRIKQKNVDSDWLKIRNFVKKKQYSILNKYVLL